MFQFVKKAKKIFSIFLTLGDDHMTSSEWYVPRFKGQGHFVGRGDLHGSKGLYQSYLLDSSAIRETFDWKDKITLDEGLDDTHEWVRVNLNLLKTLPWQYIHKT